ncbi:MAG: hybrid sensor histidine kinase/response regulator [Rhizobacter sp.]|nr:hybrid sensor histidine kinase/response regulator [Rhizobacter sp.]
MRGAFEASMEVAWVDRAFWILPRMTALNIFVAMVLMPWFWPLLPMNVLAAWLAALGVFVVSRVLAIRHLKRWRADPQRKAEGSYNRFFLLALVSGVYWGITAWLLFPYGGAKEQMLLGFVLYGLCVLNSYHISMKYYAFEAHFFCSLMPMVAHIALGGDASSILIAVTLLVIVGGTGFLSRFYLMNFRKLGEGMMWQMGQEKAAADEARRAADVARHEAEVANRAKTQFFAAASHDLRQPLHAMGLLAEALSQRSHDKELAPLVASINGSVDALEGLFSELLDITKIDSGAVTVSPEHFAAGELFRKLRLHFEPVAFDKGLSLRFRGGEQVLHADPVLVERILRNLVSNAVRYTHDGSVLVSCRRRGERVQLQVWDTGVGIPADERERIFEEFYQVADTQAQVPQERKGLGLGLSIAQRLAALMQAPLGLRSEPGRGSVFTLELPVGDVSQAHALHEPCGTAASARALVGRTILVVDDDATIRAGLEALLGGWGAKVLAFGSLQAVRTWAARADAVRPDLLIADYRLDGHHTGVEAIAAVRGRFEGGLPAIMITGSLGSELGGESADHGFQLLLKPVAPHKLRALVNFALADADGARKDPAAA